MWNGKRLAVILPTYNEHLSIAACIQGFEALGIVDEVLVVNNNAHPDTSGQVALTTAREVLESTQGYGAAIRRGFAETKSFDLVCVCEPDGTFDPADLLKLLPYTHDVDVVFGSRTTQALILSGANMGWFLKWGNWAVAKLLQVLHDGPSLSDCGCTLRLVRADAYRVFAANLTVGRSHFLPEMVCLALAAGLRMV
ncbi:MAG: glycosyltransferase family 2 protein, partial [Acidimicrobiia bacterium]|nr:glycosyltransferase family 2 protein [Acidimicrobiia bacterium]